jgi:hypothetical protein
MRFRPHQVGEFAEGIALFALESIEAGAVVADLLWRQAIQRKEKTVALILLDPCG